MEAKTIQQAPDPNLALDEARAQKAQISQLQIQAEDDTATLMARFGTRLALAGAGMSPPATPAATTQAGPTGVLGSIADAFRKAG